MRKYTLLLAVSCLLFITACQKETIAPSLEALNETQFLQLNTIEDLEAFEKSLENQELATSRSGNSFGKRVEIEAGSQNALQTAVNEAGKYGLVILKNGKHYEESTVTITQPVYILGERGASLVSAVPMQPNTEAIMYAAIHIKNTNRVTIWGLDFESAQEASGAAIIIENAKKTTVAKTNMNDFQYGVIMQKADESLIWKNDMTVTSKWLTGELLDAEGIVVMNGSHNNIYNNKVTNGVFGIFYSGSYGVAKYNETYGNFFGIIICKFAPPITISSGAIQSEISGNHWLLEGNHSHDNFDAGYLVIDGANHNTLIDNRGGNNATYDIELPGDSNRFGFFTPRSFNNNVVVGKYPTMTIKDCGEENVINGGVLIDTRIDACF